MIDQAKIQYARCTNVKDSIIFQAFHEGFSDYIIKMEFSFENFCQRFFGPEGNDKEHSFIAFYEEKPVGVILGGIKMYETIKTMRCGALAISPDFRGKGISRQLFELHKEEAIKHGCKQLFLEVIVGNDRAIRFYQNLGYERVYDLKYFSNADLSKLKVVPTIDGMELKELGFSKFQKEIQKWTYHINWQNDIDYLEKLPNNFYFGIYQNKGLVGALSIHANGNISFLMVDKNYRGRGIATWLLQTAYENLSFTKMSAGFPNNSQLEGFYKKQGFTKGSLAQYEMYLPI
ncbi:GNAT family N-acetyltransferase [Bacillus sp. BRMEA1]|uniref:GNAT family N-acetyltransferase n=1 Tax=Neobacillus endophyticus TaxID=2738405 RepID=UPI001563CE9C|nr:GNAT family N-acetyltransferase [Neobacillus endophyticus]NRD80067.1 GNAT family N-acetyltransferase [Neobacillus endophyticus]